MSERCVWFVWMKQKGHQWTFLNHVPYLSKGHANCCVNAMIKLRLPGRYKSVKYIPVETK